MEKRSIVEYFGEQQSSHCGYCKKTGFDKFSHGMWCHTVTVDDYQDLIDRGWRRSGKYCYKPLMDRTCCPQYTIRCETENFNPSKSQKKVMKRVSRYLQDGRKLAEVPTKPECHADQVDEFVGEICLADADIQKPASEKSASVAAVSHAELLSDEDARNLNSNPTAANVSSCRQEPKNQRTFEVHKRPSQKAKELRRQRKLSKLVARGVDIHSLPAKRMPVRKSLEEFLKIDLGTKPIEHMLTFHLVCNHPQSEEFRETFAESYRVYWRYQTIIHNDPPGKPTEKQFGRFLCDSPLIYEESEVEGHPGYGSFHQQYLLDGKIIAVAVLDILPKCVSSKYFYYDPDYMFLTLGTYSALREIALVRELSLLTPDLKYYYMGFYVHACPKMRYKGQYSASCLLCPEAYTWEPFTVSIKKLDESKYSRLSERAFEDENGKGIDLDRVLILFDRTAMPFVIYNRVNQKTKKRQEEDRVEVLQYSRLVGKPCAYRMLLYRD